MKSSRRRASAYITVLGTAVAITVIGLSGIMASRVRLRWSKNADDFATARIYARSAVEMGFLRIKSNSSWRTFYGSGIWETNQTIGTGTYTLLGVDPTDNNLANDPMNPVELTGIGVSGGATYKVRTTLLAETVPLTCLESAVHTGGNVTINSASINANAPLTSNLNVTATLASVRADVEAVGTILGLTFFQSIKPLAPARTEPDATVFDYFAANGTAISYGALPGGVIKDILLGPTSNPYTGVLNPNGIYVINCGNQPVSISNCRIYGTLVLLNPGSGSRVEGSVVMGPAVSNYPSLLVQGDFGVGINTAVLTEGGMGMNLNPPGAPYGGVSDSAIDDTYPSRIEGLVYVSGNVSVDQAPTIYGVLIAGGALSTALGSTLSVSYNSTFYDDPPPGFTDTPVMYVADGSWRRVVD